MLVLVQPEIRIEVILPTRWNNRLYMFGNGGFAGDNLDAPGRVSQRDTALRAGFTVAQTNTGHDAAREPGASFAVNPQKMADYSFRSLHVTAETAKIAAAAYYGARPKRSYYNGCSTGGRQGMILAQRYPDDFDGIIAGAPSLDLIANRIRAIANFQAFAKAPVPLAKLQLLAERVYQRCDAIDGLKDGLISDPRRCDFRPSRDAADLFTSEQAQALDVVYRDVVIDGRRLTHGIPPGAEIAGPNGVSGWNGWIVREGGLPQSAQFAESSLRYMVFPEPRLDYPLSQFNLQRDAPLFDGMAKLANATDPDLSRFHQRGGKLLMYTGWADPAVNPYIALDYHDSLVKRMGAATQEFFRLYLMPGVFHCGGGVGPSCFDPLAAVIAWVEQSKAPQALVVSQPQDGKTMRTRLLCPEPQLARYHGQGDPNDAANFVCSN